jgi:hypothetical protein
LQENVALKGDIDIMHGTRTVAQRREDLSVIKAELQKEIKGERESLKIQLLQEREKWGNLKRSLINK